MVTNPVIVDVQIKSPAKDIWEALTNPEKIKEWYFNIENFEAVKDEVFGFYEPGGHTYLHQCKVTEVIPNKLLQYTWAYPEFSDGTSLVTWNLIETDNSTNVMLVHENIESLASGGEAFSKENFQKGWEEILRVSLKNYLEKKS